MRVISLRQQVRWLRWKYRSHLCLIEVGSYFEAFGGDARRLACLCGLHLQKNWRGFSVGCGIPQRDVVKILAKLKTVR